MSPSTSNIFRRHRFPTYHDVISQLTLLAVFPIWRRKVSQIANFILAGNAFKIHCIYLCKIKKSDGRGEAAAREWRAALHASPAEVFLERERGAKGEGE